MPAGPTAMTIVACSFGGGVMPVTAPPAAADGQTTEPTALLGVIAGSQPRLGKVLNRHPAGSPIIAVFISAGPDVSVSVTKGPPPRRSTAQPVATPSVSGSPAAE